MIRKLVVQNINNAIDKRVVENVSSVDFPQNFQPLKQLKTNGTWYLYYESSFNLDRLENTDMYSIRRK
jgi:hypothetical protein